MSPKDLAALIVARYLKNNNFSSSYDAFIREAGLPPDAGIASSSDLTLETLLKEKEAFDVAVNFEKLGLDDGAIGWARPAPSNAEVVNTLPSSANILSARVEQLREDSDSELRPTLLASTADRKLYLLDARTLKLRATLSDLHDAPILSHAALHDNFLLSTSMSGTLVLSNASGKVLEKRKDHSKFLVKVAVSKSLRAIATAGWDNKVSIYAAETADDVSLGEPIASAQLPTKPEAMVFVDHPDNHQPILLVSRTDSSFIYFYSVEDPPRLLGQQNLAPHSNAWVAFTPSAIELCPTDPSLIAVGTSSTPHMKLLIVRLLFPPWEGQPITSISGGLTPSALDEIAIDTTQAAQARAAIALADREAAAILIHATTMAPQTAYSTPAVAWRPDGSGVWVNGDDGAVRGIEACSGKVVSTLHGHDPGSKVRCLWAGNVDVEGQRKELLVSGGFDQKLIVWKV